jgi:hypothetical protein
VQQGAAGAIKYLICPASHLDVLPAEELLEAGRVNLTQRLQDNTVVHVV